MRHRKKSKKLGRSKSHRKMLISNQAKQLFLRGRIVTTLTKAKIIKAYAEPLITRAKKGTLHDRRQVEKKIKDRKIIKKLFSEVAPLYKERNGGYTRIIKYKFRKGDNSEIAILELIDREKVYKKEEKKDKKDKKEKKEKKDAKEEKKEEKKDKKKEKKDKKEKKEKKTKKVK